MVISPIPMRGAEAEPPERRVAELVELVEQEVRNLQADGPHDPAVSRLVAYVEELTKLIDAAPPPGESKRELRRVLWESATRIITQVSLALLDRLWR